MHGSITGIHYQDLSGKIPKIPDLYYNNNNNGHLFNAACPAPAVNWQIVQQANGAPPSLTPVDLNGNSPLFAQQAPTAAMTTLSGGVGAGHQNWAVIGDDTTTASNSDGGRETPQTPTYMVNGGHQSRWTACFPPPSILPLWCITSSNQNNNIAPPQNNDQPTETAVNSYYANPRMINDATAAYKESVTPVVGVQQISLGTPVDAAYVVRHLTENAQTPTPNDIETHVENRNDTKNTFENVITNPDMDSASALSSADIEMESLRYKLQKQLEYYFSRENLTTDAYLKSQMDGDQYVAIKTIANFNKVKKMTSDLDLVISVLRESLVVQVDEMGEKVRAVSKRRTLVLRDIPDETSEAEIYELFKDEKYPKVSSVEYCHNNSWYVSFESDEDAQKAYVHLSQEMATLKGRRISARIKNDPIRRIAIVGQQQTSQANGMFSPQNIAQAQLSLSASSQTIDGSIQNLTLVPSSITSNAGALPAVHSPTSTSQASSNGNGVNGVNHKPPMDPVGASSTTPNIGNQQQQGMNAAAATVLPMTPASYATLPAAFPPGMILYAAQNPRAFAAALGTNQQLMAAGLPPNVMAGAPGAWPQASAGLFPYIDISQILTLQNHGAFRSNFPVFVPTTSAAAAAAAVNLAANVQGGYGDRRNKRNNGANSNGNRAAPNFNAAAGLIGPATFRGPMNSIAVAAHQLNMLNEQTRRLTPAGATMIPTSLAAAAAYPGMVAARPFGGAPFFTTAAAPWFDNGHHHRNFASNLPSSFTGAYANAHNRNNSNGLPMNANRHPSINNSTNNDSHANGNNHSRGYSGRSSYQSNSSDYSKDTLTSTKYRRQFSNSNYSKNYGSNYNNQTGGANHNVAAKSEVQPQEKESQASENFDLQASSFPPLSETCPSQPHAKISYAEKAKNGVVAAATAASPNKKSSTTAVITDSSNESSAVNGERSGQNGEAVVNVKSDLKNDVGQVEKTESFPEKSSRGKEYSGRKQFRNNNRRSNNNINEKFYHQNEAKIRSSAVVNQDVLINNAQEQTVSV